jgi:hypothetical protein
MLKPKGNKMNKIEFLMWLQGYILGVTGTELNQDQISRIGENLEKVYSPPVNSPGPTGQMGQIGDHGELYRC